MNENHQIQDSLSYSGDQNNKLIKAALEGGTLGAKFAGAGGGGTIIALTLDRERTAKALLDAGAEMILELDQEAFDVAVREVADGREEVAAGEGE
jgi:mevalonate kinase